MKELFDKLLHKEHLSFDEAKSLMDNIMDGNLTPAQIAGYLIALRMKGETIDEISGMAKSMRDHASNINPTGPLVDVVGTGGDLSHSFNISTTAALLVAACGVKVAKHGNRSVSSKCGAADVLENLGVNLSITPKQVEETVNAVGIGFMFAPAFHGAMKHAIGPRKELGVRTVFNVLGPLTNPASAEYELLGVFSPYLCDTMAQVLGKLGAKHALVVHGDGGLDEISISGPTKISELMEDGSIKQYEIKPEDFGMKSAPLEEVKGGDAPENAQIIKSILEGKETGAKRDIAVLNAAAALYTANKCASIKEGIDLVSQAISNGKATETLNKLVKYTQELK